MTDATSHPSPSGGTRVVVVPGLGLDERSWDAVGRLLPSGLTVVPLPALGLPAPPGLDLSPAAQAARLLAEPVVAGADRLVLVGHSAGCAVVTEAAARCSRVAGLALVAPVDPGVAAWPVVVTRWLRTAVHESPGQVRRLARQYVRTGGATMARGAHRMREHHSDAPVASTEVEVVVIRGSQDRISTASWCARLAEAGTGRVVTLDGAAHMVPITHPHDVAAAIASVGDALPRANRASR